MMRTQTAPTHTGAQQGDAKLGLLVTLTATDNTRLQPMLPLAGRLEPLELGIDGTILTAVFRTLEDGGQRLSTPVEVRNPQFVYGHGPLPVDPVTAAEHYQLGVHHLALAEGIHQAQTAVGHPHLPEGPLSLTELFERHTRLAHLHLDAAGVRTAGAAFVSNRPAMGQRAGTGAEHSGWNSELASPVHPIPVTNR